VRLNLSLADLAAAAPMPGAAGYLAEEMVTGAVAELLLGVRRDPVYGATLTLGFGGTAAELLADTVTLVLPVTAEEIAAALGAAAPRAAARRAPRPPVRRHRRRGRRRAAPRRLSRPGPGSSRSRSTR
jgi:hypothetical protein